MMTKCGEVAPRHAAPEHQRGRQWRVQQFAGKAFQTGRCANAKRGHESFGYCRAEPWLRLVIGLKEQVSSRGQC